MFMVNDVLSNLSINNVVSANRINAKPNIYTYRQNRDHWGIAIKYNGSTQYTCNGKTFLSDSQNIIILPKGISYSWISKSGKCLMIDFDANVTAEEIYSFNITDNSKAIDIFDKLETCLLLKPPYYKIKSLQLLYKLLLLLLDSENKKYVNSVKKDKCLPALEYITKHYDNPEINGKFLSDLTNMSYTYFRKIFAETYGCAPMEYLHIQRMKKAAEMLKSDYNSIKSISESVGYNSIYHFSKMFKKHFGISPSKFSPQKQI